MRWEITGAESLIADRLGRAWDLRTVPNPFVVEVTGASVDPDKLESVYRIGGVEGELLVVVVGKEQWVKLPGSTVIGPTSFQGSLDDINDAVDFWDHRIAQAIVPLSCAGNRVTVNNLATRHCQVTGATMQQLAMLLGANIGERRTNRVSFDVWLHEGENYPVRVRVSLQGTDEKDKEFNIKGDMDITDVNSTNIQVTPPR